MQKPIVRIDTLVAELKTGVYPIEKEEHFMEGFKKISASIDSIEQKLDQGEFESAQQELRISTAFVKSIMESVIKHLEQDLRVHLLINRVC